MISESGSSQTGWVCAPNTGCCRVVAKSNCILIICGEEPDVRCAVQVYTVKKKPLSASWSVKSCMLQTVLNAKCRVSNPLCLPTNMRFVLLKGVTGKFGKLKSVRDTVLTLEININHIVLLLNPKNVLSVLFASRFVAVNSVR